MLTDKDLKKIQDIVAKVVRSYVSPPKEVKYITSEEKAKQLHISRDRFMHIYKTLGIPYKREIGTRRLLFEE